MSTNTGGPAGPGPGGGAGTGPKLADFYDRAMAHLDRVADALSTRVHRALIAGDRVAEADAMTGLADLRIAAQLADGAAVDEIDRNGWPVRAR